MRGSSGFGATLLFLGRSLVLILKKSLCLSRFWWRSYRNSVVTPDIFSLGKWVLSVNFDNGFVTTTGDFWVGEANSTFFMPNSNSFS